MALNRARSNYARIMKGSHYSLYSFFHGLLPFGDRMAKMSSFRICTKVLCRISVGTGLLDPSDRLIHVQAPVWLLPPAYS